MEQETEERKEYFKGFILDRRAIAKLAGVESTNDPEDDIYSDIIIKGLNRNGFDFIGLVRDVPRKDYFALAIVLKVGSNAEELEKIELDVDDTIMDAKPHVLIGPGVWELYD